MMALGAGYRGEEGEEKHPFLLHGAARVPGHHSSCCQCSCHRQKPNIVSKQPPLPPPSTMRLPSRASCFSVLRHNALTIFTIIGVVCGVILGIVLRGAKEGHWPAREIMYVNFIGELFLRMLRSLILPLIVSSLISAIGSLDLSLSRKIGARAIIYYMCTTLIAVSEGILLVMTIHPGSSESDTGKKDPKAASYLGTTEDTMLDLARKLFPPNIVQACIFSDRTKLTKPPPKPVPTNSTDTNSTIMMFEMMENVSTTAMPEEDDIYEYAISFEWVESMNIMGLVVFSVVLGIALGKMGEKGKPLLNVFTSLSQAMMEITKWVICIAPVGVMFLIAAEVLRMESFAEIMGKLGLYTVTVLCGVLFHGFILLPIIYTLATRKLPFRFIANFAQPLATAFSTASSSATLPVAISALEERNKIDPRVTRFVLPIGSTINMDGTALYEAVAAIFIAQVRGVPLNPGNIIAISITATLASIGAAGIPQAGLITMVMVLDTVGLPAEDVSLILAVDWFLDRFRTMVNVLGDALGAGIVDHLSRHELAGMPEADTNTSSSSSDSGSTYSEPDVEKIPNICISNEQASRL